MYKILERKMGWVLWHCFFGNDFIATIAGVTGIRSSLVIHQTPAITQECVLGRNRWASRLGLCGFSTRPLALSLKLHSLWRLRMCPFKALHSELSGFADLVIPWEALSLAFASSPDSAPPQPQPQPLRAFVGNSPGWSFSTAAASGSGDSWGRQQGDWK